MAAMRRNAPFLTLPFAAVVGMYQLCIQNRFLSIVLNIFFCSGFIGYKLEGYLSDKYTPYNGIIFQFEFNFRCF